MRLHHVVRPGLAFVFMILTSPFAPRLHAQDTLTAPTELLWPDGAPAAMGSEEADKPWLWLYPADAANTNGAAVVVCPGGGYGFLAIHHEGEEIAHWLNGLGVSAFVLKYRIAPRYGHPAPLTDAQRAIRMVRARAAEWKIDPARVGVIGFSAGGHLASSVSTHFDDGRADAPDAIERVSCRPDFAILGYPVITFDPPHAHLGSRRNLLGENPDPALVESYCNDRQVTQRTPPTFLFHTNEDDGVVPENSVLYYLALRTAGVAAEMHIYEKGPHGVGLAANDPVLSTWPQRCAAWLEGRGVLRKAAAE